MRVAPPVKVYTCSPSGQKLGQVVESAATQNQGVYTLGNSRISVCNSLNFNSPDCIVSVSEFFAPEAQIGARPVIISRLFKNNRP